MTIDWWKPIAKYGDHIKMDEFVNDVGEGYFSHYDGFAYYATTDKMLADQAQTVDLDNIDKSYTHVVWFNK